MKIAIIGAGWFGCYIASELKKKNIMYYYMSRANKFFLMLLVIIKIDCI